MEKSILSAKGRISRATFWIRTLIAGAVYYGLYFYMQHATSFLLGMLSGVGMLLACIFMMIQGVKRMHDIDKSGWFILIPIYGFVLTLFQGLPGLNQYGEDPKGRN